MRAEHSRKVKWWIGLTLPAALLALALPLAVVAGNQPTPDDVPAGIEPVATGQKVVVASGKTSSDITYSLTAYQSDQGLCLDFEHSEAPGLVSGACGFGIRGERNIAGDETISAITERSGSADSMFVYGLTIPEARSVEIILKSGRVLDIPTQAPSQSFGESEFDFYFAEIPGETSVNPRILDEVPMHDEVPEHHDHHEVVEPDKSMISASPTKAIEAKNAQGDVIGRFTRP